MMCFVQGWRYLQQPADQELLGKLNIIKYESTGNHFIAAENDFNFEGLYLISCISNTVC